MWRWPIRKQTFKFSFKAPPEVIYQAMLDPKLLEKWRVPDGMQMQVHQFDPSVNGKFRISLIYDDPNATGKSGKSTDTYHGYFKTLIPNQKIVETMEFESKGPEFAGEMTVTTDLIAKNGGTEMVATHENLPQAVPEDQNEVGWKMSLTKLAKLLEEKSQSKS